MTKLAFKVLLAAVIGVTIVLFRIITVNLHLIKESQARFMPRNNVSNSPCFKAKLDHLVQSPNFKNCTLLVAGSSMSLNNISGRIIQEQTGESVYNISSWGLKPRQLNEFLQRINVEHVRSLLIGFNNCDFGTTEYRIDFKAVDAALNGNKLRRYWSAVNEFNIQTFSKDWSYRAKFASISNSYQSINFDKFGSVLFEPAGFVINDHRWNARFDSTGFSNFYQGITAISNFCERHKIKLLLAYLPTRPNLLSPEMEIQNQTVSNILCKKFPTSYVDMQKTEIPAAEYCDGIHLFRGGAERLTVAILDSLRTKK